MSGHIEATEGIAAVDMETLVSLCKRRGFVFQSSEIYGGLQGAWDYGPLGVEMTSNIKRAWWRAMVQERDDIVGIDAAILMHPDVWRASGHVETFADPMVDCRNCQGRFRADELDSDVCPNCGSKRPVHRAAHVQPDAADVRRAGGGRRRDACTCGRRRRRACS